MCRWYCLSEGPSTNLKCLTCGTHYCGACLHGEAGKMPSLIKCAQCGKKPGVRSNANRSAWAGGSKPVREDYVPPVDRDLGAFVSGLRDTGANMSNSAANRVSREVPTDGARALRGPERFFYDKSSYTGTHAKGGPEHVAKGAGTFVDQSWKRPSTGCDVDMGEISRAPLRSSSLPRSGTYGGSRPSTPPLQLQQGSRPTTPLIQVTTPTGSEVVAYNASKFTFTSNRPTTPLRNSRPTTPQQQSRSSSKGASNKTVACDIKENKPRPRMGPERFFYDKSTYTGCHAKGGPASVPKGNGTFVDQSWKRER